jgi:hypothetical protein
VYSAAAFILAGAARGAPSADQCLSQYRDYLAQGAPADYCSQNDCGACIIARRGVGFVDHQRLELDVELTAVCKGVFCAAGQTCGKDGSCVSSDTVCEGGKCEVGTGGAGGGGSSSSSSSASSASTSVSSSASSGTGGAGGGCGDPTGPLQLGSLGQVMGGTGIASDHNGLAWVISTSDMWRCSTSQCLPHQPLPSPIYGSLVRVSASPAAVAVAQTVGVSTNPSSWISTSGCVSTVLDVQVDDAGVVYVAGSDGAGVKLAKGTTSSCQTLLVGQTGTARGFVFPTGEAFLASGNVLYATGAAAPFSSAGGVASLWGYTTPSQRRVAFACGQLGLAAYELAMGVIDHATLYPNAMCKAVSGFARCDGTADLWTVSATGDLMGFHYDPNAPGPLVPLAQESVPGAVSVSVDRDGIWVLTQSDVQRSARPNL